MTSRPSRVEFLGFAPSGEVACRWVSENFRILRVESQESLALTVHVGTRYLRFEPSVKVSAREGWELHRGDRHNFLRTVEG
jgi:hypothetical protein